MTEAMSKKRKKTQDPDVEAEAQASPEETEAADSPAASEVEEQADDLEAPRAERDDLLARLQRVSADYLNYQKRMQRDVSQAREFANTELIEGLLPVLDDMERALAAALENHGQDDPLFSGLQMVHDKALEVLGKFGLRQVQTVGRPFDPEVHAAMMQQPSDEHPPQTVLQELQKGYTLRGRTIRPARVIVSQAVEDG